MSGRNKKLRTDELLAELAQLDDRLGDAYVKRDAAYNARAQDMLEMNDRAGKAALAGKTDTVVETLKARLQGHELNVAEAEAGVSAVERRQYEVRHLLHEARVAEAGDLVARLHAESERI